MGDADDRVNMLIEKINLHDLKDGAVFEFDEENLDAGFQSALEKEQEYYGAELADNIDTIPGTVLEDAMEDLRVVPGSMDFATLALQMVNVTNDGRIKKRIIREGVGPIVPETALLEMHYSSYLEHADEPFDSSYLRGRPLKMVLSSGDCLPGILIAVASMKKRELAQFIIHPSLGYGKMGAPPRIPSNAEILFEAELLGFIDGVQTASSDTETTNVVDKMKMAKAKYLEGNQFYKKGGRKIPDAIIKYKKALSMLDQCVQATDEGEDERKRLVITLCSNLGLCYNKVKNYQQTCKVCRRAVALKPDHCKALFSYGRALLKLGEYDMAREYLLKAKQVEPTNTEINAEIILLDKEHRAYLANAKSMTKRMFDAMKPEENSEVVSEKSESKWYDYLADFAKNEKATNLTLPNSITVQELEDIKLEASSLGLAVDKTNNVICIKKQA